MSWFLLRDDGRLRSAWRVVLHGPLLLIGFLVAMSCVVVADTGRRALFGLGPPESGQLVLLYTAVMAAMTATGLVLHAVSGLLLDARWRGGWSRGRVSGGGLGGPLGRSLSEVAGGVLLGLFALVPAVGILAIAGLEVVRQPVDADRLIGFSSASVMLVFAAGFEEILFRGYAWLWAGAAMAGALRWVGAPGRGADAVGFGLVTFLVAGVIFGGAHLMNDNVTVLSILNTVLAGVWLAVLVLRTRAIWMAWGAHWAWNWGHGVVLGMPLSGNGEDGALDLSPLLRTTSTAEAEWLSGGGYGLEGSVATTLALVLVIGLSAMVPRRAPEDGSSALDGRWLDTGRGAADEGTHP